MLVAVNFHYIRESFEAPYPAIFGLSPRELRQRLEILSHCGTFVSADEVRLAVTNGSRLPERAILITFDDGLREQYEYAWPILKEMGIPGLFFVNSWPIAEVLVCLVHKIHLLRASVAPDIFEADVRRLAAGLLIDLGADITPAQYGHYRYDSVEAARLKYLLNILLAPAAQQAIIERLFAEYAERVGNEAALSRLLYMDKEQLQALAEAGCLGSHAHEHHPLGLLPESEITRQLSLSAAYLSEWTGRAPFAISYPYGSRSACTQPVIRAASEARFVFGFTMERAGNPDLSRPLQLARFDNNDVPGGKAFTSAAQSFFDELPVRAWD